MKNIFKAALLAIACSPLSGCYEGYVDDFANSTSQFIAQRPLRTVIADRDMTIYVGVDIGGKREVDMADWAKFVIDPTLLEGVAGKTLMPQSYYQLGDQGTMRVRKSNLPVADVGITFTQAFYDDPLSLTNTYVIPFRITESSCDVIPEGKDYSLVCVKYASSFSGTYYVRGKKTAVADADGNPLAGGAVADYYYADISRNFTQALTSLGTDRVRRAGAGDVGEMVTVGQNQVPRYRAALGMTPAAEGAEHDFDVTVTTGDGDGIEQVTKGTGRFYDAPFDVYLTEDQARFELEYVFQSGAEFFKVEEELIRRRDPYMDLRFETW